MAANQAQAGSNYNWGDLAASGWGPLHDKKLPLDFMDDKRTAHSGTVQDHLTNRVFTASHNSADELNDVITSKSDENENDAEPKSS